MTEASHNISINKNSITSYNPVTKKPIKTIDTISTIELNDRLDELVESSADWSSTSLKSRSKQLINVRKVIVKNYDRIIVSLAEETGKTNGEAHNEVFATLEHLKYLSKEGPRYLKSEYRKAGILKSKKGYINYLPHGVVGVITPWNFPFFLSILPIAEALIAGNTVIFKPSELTPLIGQKIHDIFIEGGISTKVFQIAQGEGDVGAAIVRNNKTDMICFVGSVEVGKEIGAVCGEMMKPVLLELGGNDPMIVLEDANLERAANAAIWGGMTNCGQICISVERVYVIETIANKFIGLVKKKIASLKYGQDKENMDMGSLADNRQHTIVLNHIKDAKNKGGKISVGGENRDDLGGYFIEPTIVENVNHNMNIMKKETFGPEIAIMRVKNEEEAIKMANDTTYGLAASVFSKNKKRARKVAKQLKSGSVCINDVMANLLFPSLPFGGVKNSGIGRDYGIEGLRSFTQIQAVCEDRIGLKKELWWYPMSKRTQSLFRKFAKLYY